MCPPVKSRRAHLFLRVMYRLHFRKLKPIVLNTARYVTALLAIVALLDGIYLCWSMGNARNSAEYIQAAGRLPQEVQTDSLIVLADKAVRDAPADPETHYARA